MDITRVLPPNGEKAQRSKGSHLSSQVGFKPLLARDTPCLFISWWCSILNCLQSRTEHSFSKFETSCAAGAPQRMKKDILVGGKFSEEDDQRYTVKNVSLKLSSGVWTNHCMLPHLLQVCVSTKKILKSSRHHLGNCRTERVT